MSLLSDLNDKIKALSTRVAAQFKTQQSDIDSKVANVTLSGTTLTVTKGDGTSSTYTTTDTNTTYTAGTGLSLSNQAFSLATSGVTAGTVGGTAAATLSHGGTFTTPYITFDAYGRATGYGTRTLTLPADNNTDTKVTNTASNTKKFYITGTSSSSTNTGTQYFDTGVYVTATAGYLHCTRLEVGSGTIWVA